MSIVLQVSFTSIILLVPRSMTLWDLIVEKFENKSSMWKRQDLSLRGRITLIIASMSNLPVYCMSLQNA